MREKLLGVKLDWKLNFDDHRSDICKKARRKLNTLVRIAPFIGLSKGRLLINVFFNPQFNDCLLIWLCHSRKINKNINRRSCFFYNNNRYSFQNYLKWTVLLLFTWGRFNRWLLKSFVMADTYHQLTNGIFTQKDNSRYTTEEKMFHF